MCHGLRLDSVQTRWTYLGLRMWLSLNERGMYELPVSISDQHQGRGKLHQPTWNFRGRPGLRVCWVRGSAVKQRKFSRYWYATAEQK